MTPPPKSVSMPPARSPWWVRSAKVGNAARGAARRHRRLSHSWPRTNNNGHHWIGAGGGYGGFYCFALDGRARRGSPRGSATAIWPEGAPDALNGRFGSVDLAGNFSGWADVPLEIPSQAEAQAAVADELAEQAEAEAEAERVAAANRAMLAERPSTGACAAAPVRAGRASGLASLALVLAAALRRRR
jgi:hypothetical protein